MRDWPDFERLQRLVARFSAERSVALPRFAAGRWFRTRFPEGASQAHAIVADDPMGDGRVIFDPSVESAERPYFLSWIAPSPDGRTLAVGVCADGSENNTIRLIDVSTGHLLCGAPTQILMDNWTGGVEWLPDSSGFFFSAIKGPAIDFAQDVYLHRRTPEPTTVRLDIVWTSAVSYRMVLISRDGKYAVAMERHLNPIPVAIAELGAAPLRWRPFITTVTGTVAGHILGGRYIAVTDVGAPRGRIVAIAIDANDPNDPSNWQELLCESNAVLRTITPVGSYLYLSEFVDTYSRVRSLDLDGKVAGTVPLPGRGAVNEHPCALFNLVPKGHPAQFLFGFSSLTVSAGIYRHRPGRDVLEVLREPEVSLENAVVEDRWAVSTDGARVPYHVVRRVDVEVGQPLPALIFAYGGYNIPLVPQFPGPMAAFAAAGGIFVHAHLRGGAELGLDWWQSGRLSKKQNCYHDLYAVAEDLIAINYSAPQLLAVTGVSNGGLLAGVAATQRPELWGVVVPRVPLIDLIGACRDPYGQWAVRIELADVESPQEVCRLATFSPYHLVREGVRYPAVYIDAGDTDPRCPPWHARKFAARLQAATAGDAPILLHVWENVGHGWATNKEVAVVEHTEWLAFTLRHLGLKVP